jgi:hypothetical protein
MVIVFDKNIDPNITKVETNDEEGTAFYWTFDLSNWMVNSGVNGTYTISMGADGTKITFTNQAAMQPYIAQFKALYPDIHSPYTSVTNDPHYDRMPPSGQIVPHTYVNTDIEKDLIEGN